MIKGLERASGANGMSDTTHLQPEHAGMRVPLDRAHGTFSHPTAFSLGSLAPNVSLEVSHLLCCHSFCLDLFHLMYKIFDVHFFYTCLL